MQLKKVVKDERTSYYQAWVFFVGFKDQETRRPKQFEDDVEGEGDGSEESADQINVDGIDDGLLEEVIQKLYSHKSFKYLKYHFRLIM
jgi:hypothetical protein